MPRAKDPRLPPFAHLRLRYPGELFFARSCVGSGSGKHPGQLSTFRVCPCAVRDRASLLSQVLGLLTSDVHRSGTFGPRLRLDSTVSQGRGCGQGGEMNAYDYHLLGVTLSVLVFVDLLLLIFAMDVALRRCARAIGSPR